MSDNGTENIDLNALIETFKFGAIEVKEEEPFLLEGSNRPVEALVLVTLNTVCRSCGSRHSMPNFRLLFRRKRKLFAATTYFSGMNALPREVREHTDTVPACKVCFKTTTFTAREILGGKKK